MAGTVFGVYALLTHKIKPFDVFQTTAVKKSLSMEDVLKDPSAIGETQVALIQSVLGTQMNDVLNFSLSTVFFYVLMLFGFRLSNLGVMLMRPIEVKLKTKEEKIQNNTQ